MAQLHGRVRRLQDRRLTRTALFVAGCAIALATGRGARAQEVVASTAPSENELAGLVRDLASADAQRREAAYRSLSTLDEDAVPAIAGRLRAIATRRPPPDEASYVLTKFRHGAGSRRADDMVDIAPGVLALLRQRRDPAVLQMAEPLLYMRSLERMGTLESGKLVGEIIALDGAAWRPEWRRLNVRAGVQLFPTLLVVRSHRHPEVRRWSRGGIRALGLESPGRAIQQRDTALLADILRAYGTVLEFSAMPVIVSFAGSDRVQLREASRWAIERFGRNVVWQLRAAYESSTGRQADARWGWERTMRELFAALDNGRLGPVRADLEAGLAAERDAAREEPGSWRELAALERMRRHFDAVLLRAPRLDRSSEMAVGYARLGRAKLGRHDFDGAERALRRALRIAAPEHPDRRAWQADLAYVVGQRRLATGIADVPSFERALALIPEHEPASEILDRVTGEARARARRWRRIAALAAAMILAGIGWSLRRRRRAPERASNVTTAVDLDSPAV